VEKYVRRLCADVPHYLCQEGCAIGDVCLCVCALVGQLGNLRTYSYEMFCAVIAFGWRKTGKTFRSDQNRIGSQRLGLLRPGRRYKKRTRLVCPCM